MKRFIAFVTCALLCCSSASAQSFKVYAKQNDQFSQSLVKLLNAAPNQFSEYKGKLLGYSDDGETIYRLKIPFPKSTAAVISYRESYDQNSYVEFGTIKTKKDLATEVRDLITKLKKALGDELDLPVQQLFGGKDSIYWNVSAGIKNKNGYFDQLLHIYTGKSNGSSILPATKTAHTIETETYHIILKVEGRLPDFQYFIHPVVSPNISLHKTLRTLIDNVRNDFDSLTHHHTLPLTGKSKKTDTLQIEGNAVIVNFRKANYTANLNFPTSKDSLAFDKQWKYYQKIIQAAVGINYVYHEDKSENMPLIVYFRKVYDESMPVIYLEKEKKDDGSISIVISVQSTRNHPTKRGMDPDDF